MNLRDEFEKADKTLEGLHLHYSEATQKISIVRRTLDVTKNYWLTKAEEVQGDPSQGYIIGSGAGALAGLNSTLQAIATASVAPLDLINFASASGITFGSNTAAMSHAYPAINVKPLDLRDLPPVLPADPASLPARFSKLNPALGDVCAGAFECLYGTRADPERALQADLGPFLRNPRAGR